MQIASRRLSARPLLPLAWWLMPLTFLAVMSLGALLGAAGLALPFAEQGIAASLLVLGVLVAAAARLPLASSAILVGLFALFHGHAHGAEMPASAPGLAYGAGFLIATAALHAAGLGAAWLLSRVGPVRLVRLAGAAIVVCGLRVGVA